MSLIKLEICSTKANENSQSHSRHGSLDSLDGLSQTQDMLISLKNLDIVDKKGFSGDVSSTPSLQHIPASPFQRRREQMKAGSFPSLDIISFSNITKTEKKLSSEVESNHKEEEENEFSSKYSGKKYNVIEVLGSGYQGKVFKLRSEEQIFAGKHLRGNADEEAFSNLRNEFNILRQLSHPNILKVQELFEVEGKSSCMLVMDYFKGKNLEEILNERDGKGLSEREVTLLLKQLLETLLYLHSNSVCHRDLSLTNILVKEPEWIVAVIDFGLSAKIDRGLMTPTGLKKYRAPEMSSLDEYNEKVDIWSSGVILLITLTQDSHCWDRNKIVKEGSKTLDTVEHYSEGLLKLVKQMLTVESKNRPTAQECLNILYKLI